MDDVDRGHNENGFGQASYFGALPLPLCILLTDSGRGGVPLIFQILIDILTWQNLNGAFRLFNWPTNFIIEIFLQPFTIFLLKAYMTQKKKQET